MANPSISFHRILQSQVATFPIIDGRLIFCTDTSNMYIDSGNERVKVSTEIETLLTEADRESLLTPVNGKFYYIIETANMYVYYNSAWRRVNVTIPDMHIELLEAAWTTVSANSYTQTITNPAIRSYHVATIMPDLTIADLFVTHGITVKSVSNDSIVVNATTKPTYDLWCSIHLE